MTTSQLILAWDGLTLKVEAPSSNGTRKKIENVSFDDLPETIQFELQTQLAANKAREQHTVEAPSASRDSWEETKRNQNKEIAKAREAKHNSWLDSLDPLVADWHREKIRKKQEAQEQKRGELIWTRVATDHSVELANRVVTDPARRPKMIVVTKAGAKEVHRRPGQEEKTSSPRKVKPTVDLASADKKLIANLDF